MNHLFTRCAAIALSAAMAVTLSPAASSVLVAQGAGGLALAATTDSDVSAAIAAIDALPELKGATSSDASAIETAHELYAALDETQKAEVPAEKVANLTALYDALADAQEVAAQIEALPAATSAKKSDYAAIVKVVKSYEALAQSALVKKSLRTKISKLEDLVYYASAPVPSYKLKTVGSSKTKTVTDSKTHTFKAGLGKIKVSLPKSGYDSKTALSGGLSYGLKTYGKKTKTAKKSTWIGSTSKSRVVQAFKLSFSGDIAEHYDVYYRAKVSRLGWGGWAKNGSWAGSTGMKLRIVGLQVKFVKKGSAAPGSTANACPGKATVSYHVNRVSGGWTSYKKSGATAGTVSWKAGIKQVGVKVKSDLSGSIKVSVLKRKGGWTAYGTDKVGSTAKSKQAQAVKIKLTGALAKSYNVYYRVYASDYHWLGWAKNGQAAGTKGHKYSMGALQVKLVLKGDGAPGSTSKHYTTKAVPWSSGGQLTMTRKAQKYSSATGWLVLVNRNTTHVGVFKGSKGSWNLVRYIRCDVGATSTPTPTGTRTVQYRIPSFGEEKGYSVYKATNIGGGYYFHSILYYANTKRVMDGTLGAWCSHGCIRMSYANASYIYSHVSNGTTVKIY